jgi:hypothetical protein
MNPAKAPGMCPGQMLTMVMCWTAGPAIMTAAWNKPMKKGGAAALA